MKRYLATVALGGCLALIINTNATSQEPSLVGELSPLIVACSTLTEITTADGLIVKNCRRSKPDEFTGHKAVIHVRVMTDLGAIYAKVNFQKTLWQISSAYVEDK